MQARAEGVSLVDRAHLLQESASEGPAFLATLPATRFDRRLAWSLILISTAIFFACAPFARSRLPEVWPFLPIYQSALAVCDLITAVLLFAQFGFVRSRGLLLLGGAYVFSALMAIAHLLSFPGLFAPSGIIGGNGQTTAWLYFLWHATFPLAVIAYASTGASGPQFSASGARGAILMAVACAVGVAFTFVFLTTGERDVLPQIMRGNRDAPAKLIVATASWALCLVAVPVLWRRRPQSVLDLWLTAVMCVWVFDVALASVLNAGRFDLGWYAGRIYGLAAGSFVLVVLLVQNGNLYLQMLHANLAERQQRARAERAAAEAKRAQARLEAVNAELEAVNKELESFSYSVSHDLRAPLRAVDGYARMLQEDHAPRLDDEGRRLLGVVRSSSQQMGRLIDDLLAFSRLGRQPVAKTAVNMLSLARAALDHVVGEYPHAAVELADLPSARGDPALLKQVWINLIGNGLKYSAKGAQPRVEVGGRADGAGREYWVRDNGVGFDMKYAEKLFRVFQRLHRPDEFEGTGVGLAIVHRVVGRHGGRVWAESAPGEGACFRFWLPQESE